MFLFEVPFDLLKEKNVTYKVCTIMRNGNLDPQSTSLRSILIRKQNETNISVLIYTVVVVFLVNYYCITGSVFLSIKTFAFNQLRQYA